MIQICFGKIVYLFRVHLSQPLSFPTKLAEVIAPEDILKTGKNIQNDFTRLQRKFNINVAKGQGKVELGSFCYSKGAISRSSLRLDQICGHILNVYLPKTPMIRCGNWEAAALSEEQKVYAALDAWVSLEIYNQTKCFPTVNQKINESAPDGTFVSIY